MQNRVVPPALQTAIHSMEILKALVNQIRGVRGLELHVRLLMERTKQHAKRVIPDALGMAAAILATGFTMRHLLALVLI